jgi:hypothetical protein
MIAKRTGRDVITVSASKDEVSALYKSWRREVDGSVSILLSTTAANTLEKALEAALMTAPPTSPDLGNA